MEKSTYTLRRISITTAIVIFTVLACVFCSCNTESKKIIPDTFPNTVAENAIISDEFKDVSLDLSNQAIDLFLNEITKIPHPSGNIDQIRKYLVDWGYSHGLSTNVDKSGSVYIDVPASSGQENSPKVILQSHIDMVGVSTDENIDMKFTSLDTVYDKENGQIYTRDHKTTLGADDGEGIVTLLAIASNKNVVHGPLRLLFTYDEETTMQGAKDLSPNVLDSNYVINVDWSNVGVIIKSSSGSFMPKITVPHKTVQNTKDNIMHVKINGFVGGHSGVDITKNRSNANVVLFKSMYELLNNDIAFNMVYFKGGTASNAISTFAETKIAINSQDFDKASDLIKNYFNSTIKDSDDKDAKIETTKDLGTNVKCFTDEDNALLFERGSQFTQGVIKMNENYSGIPFTSSNLGYVLIENGTTNIWDSFRSTDNNVLNDYINAVARIVEESGGTKDFTAITPAWEESKEGKFASLMLEAYKEVCGFEGITNVTHGALENSWLAIKNPNAEIISIGADVKDEHAPTETMFTKSLPAHFASILYVLKNISSIA